MPEDWRFALRWKRTWQDRFDDLEGHDRNDPRCLAYVRRNKASLDAAEAWQWSVLVDDNRIASGFTAKGPVPAVRAAEQAWAGWKELHPHDGSGYEKETPSPDA